jgi:hypothetical protein
MQMQYVQDHAQVKDTGLSSSFDCWSAFFELLIVTAPDPLAFKASIIWWGGGGSDSSILPVIGEMRKLRKIIW